jgi:hypothetical protein
VQIAVFIAMALQHESRTGSNACRVRKRS